jgi:DNA-binding transcriptional LysR family regulator
MLHGRLLVYISEVASLGSIRKASEKLHISASSINRQIIALEKELGLELFERMPRKLRLTAAGEVLLLHVRQTLKEYRRVQSQLKQLNATHRGSLTIATQGGLASTLIAQLSNWLHLNHPYVKLSVKVLPRELIASSLTDGDADVGLGYCLASDSSFRILARAMLPVGAVVSPTHPLALASSTSLGDCAGYRMMIPDRSTNLGVRVADALDRSSIGSDWISETNSIELLKISARNEGVVTFLNPLDVLLEIEAGHLAFVPLVINQIGPSELRLVQRRNSHLDPTQSVVVARMADMIQELRVENRRRTAV